MYALADCNNFFVSCERAFQPQLEGRPVVVLSNNDGCVVARSNEAKAIDIAMGTPFFKLKNLVDAGRLEVRSSNYTLYGDLSHRVMNILREAVPDMEVYSIDEAFLNLDGYPEDQWMPLCRGLVKQVKQWVGLPISIGIAPSKTLGKVANHFAKHYGGYRGVCAVDTPEKRDKALKLTPIDDVWGVGWRGAPKLEALGVHTAWDLVCKPENWVLKHMSITGVRTWKELQGISCIEENDEERRQTICTSRSFADLITDKDELALRISDFAGMCAAKLRKDGSAAGEVAIFLQTNRFRSDLPQYYPFLRMRLETAVNNTTEIVGAALALLDTAWKDGYGYKRAGVIVAETVPADEVQGSLFDSVSQEERDRENRISAIMDKVNSNGRTLLRVATQRPGHYADGIRREHCSPLYSTDWSQLLVVK
ncbi:MAG: Y-family DNA polymerase [Bacteroidales bacterium]|nr:Y-family DNA polymerase [Bacteroidales bacterium]